MTNTNQDQPLDLGAFLLSHCKTTIEKALSPALEKISALAETSIESLPLGQMLSARNATINMLRNENKTLKARLHTLQVDHTLPKL